MIAGTDPMPRIERSEDDIYMLYTGGTTGMPKGVMYDIGLITGYFCTLGFGGIGLPVPESAEAVAPLVADIHQQGQ